MTLEQTVTQKGLGKVQQQATPACEQEQQQQQQQHAQGAIGVPVLMRSSWCCNPQFRLTVAGSGSVVVCLGQRDTQVGADTA